MLVVNLYGAPCAGKSTAAAYVFSQLKMAGVNCELVTEFAKDMVYDNCIPAFRNQLYVLGNQFYRLTRLEDAGVEVAITDSPLLLSVYYNESPALGEEFDKLVACIASHYPTLNYFLESKWDFSDVGRRHFDEDSSHASQEIKSLMEDYGVDYVTIDDLDIIVAEVIERV